jgi:hypothetical protein
MEKVTLNLYLEVITIAVYKTSDKHLEVEVTIILLVTVL